MNTSITLGGAIGLFGAMTVLALVPGISVLTVVTRAVSSGFRHGAADSAGIVAGDIVFILIAMSGLALLAEAMGPAFDAIKYLGGAYLIFLGIRQWQAEHASNRLRRQPRRTHRVSWPIFL